MTTTVSRDSNDPLDDVEGIADATLHGKSLRVAKSQTEHRIDLARRWDITAGERVLEIGCGQGDATVVLAAAVGPSGHVTALDPAPSSYGSPYTLGQAQEHISKGPLGGRIKFIQSDPSDFLRALPAVESDDGSKRPFDVVVLSHCIWYFAAPEVLAELLRLVSEKKAAKRVCVAEYSLSSSTGPSGLPHVFAALARASLECRKDPSETRSNIRTILSPSAISAIAVAEGWKVQSESIKPPPLSLDDGRWEVGAVKDSQFDQDLKDHVENPRERSVVTAIKDAMLASISSLNGGSVSTMDVWTAVLVPS